MSDRTEELETKVAALQAEMSRLGERLTALEAGRSSAAVRRAPPPGAARSPGEAGAKAAPGDSAVGLVGSALSLGGRTLLVLAGAFVLRALTDNRTIPAWLGVVLGFLYAATWIVLADRDARAGRSTSAGVHGLAALLIAFPLLYEATARFGLMAPAAATAVLAVIASALLVVAARRRLQSLAWLTMLGGMLTAISFGVSSGQGVPGVLFLILLGLECLWLSYVLDWHALRWPVAVVADLAVLVVAVRAVAPEASEGPAAAMLVQAALLAGYQASFATRTLLLQRGVVAFEVFQTIGVVAAGLGGAAFVAARTSAGVAIPFGVAATLFGLAGYGVAFAFRERRQQDRANFPFYASVALLLLGSGTALLLGSAALGVTWSGLALVAAVLAVRLGRQTLAIHAAAWATGAAFASGLLPAAWEMVFAPAARAWSMPGEAAAIAFFAAAGCAWVGRALPASFPTLRSRLPQLTLVLVAAAGAAGLLIALLVPSIAGVPGADASRGAVATIRTVVLVLGALILAAAGRRESWREAGWLAYPVLVLAGLKILFEDLPGGKPATLFVSFGLYGAALLLVPRLRSGPSKRQPRTADSA